MNDMQQAPLVDVGNQFIGPDYPGQLVVGKIMTPVGERLCLTVRCGPATVTVTMSQDSAKQWSAQIAKAAGNMSGLIVPNGTIKGL